jgi:HSP20 family protein
MIVNASNGDDMPISFSTDQPFPSLSRQASKIMEQMQKGFFYPSESWTPNVNLYETSGSYLVCVDLAGVDKEKIDVHVADQRLKLRGARAVPDFWGPDSTAHEKVRVHLMEIDHGGFTREVEIPPDADRQNIAATYRNGLLWIEIPKVEPR